MLMFIAFELLISLVLINKCNGISSPLTPFINYKHSIELEPNIADLWWTIDDSKKEIIFEYHVKSTGWIALGISPAGGMEGADIGVGWIDNNGKIYFQDRMAFDFSKPLIDNTTTDWFALQGREQNGWTSIQFKRLLDTCDTMDVPIKSGTNIIIFAYGIVDPDLSKLNDDISYHESRRGTRIIPLRSYGNPPSDEKFSGLDSIDFRLNNYLIPSIDTSYYCQVFKVPSRFIDKRHIIAYKILIDPNNKDLVHHMTTFECDSSMIFDDDENLPSGICDDILIKYSECLSNVANGWAVGGDPMVAYPVEAGYQIGGNHSVKYFMVQIHFANPQLSLNRYDNTGIRFYIGNELRQHDIGYLTLGTQSGPVALAIPPGVPQFLIDSYCPITASERFPESGITVISAFPHTHIQGKTVWTKIIRNERAIQYLFNAESFNFNYQFENLLPKPIQLFKNDSFITRCIYDTMNKDQITLGGGPTTDEMCSHSFTYYPRMNNLFICVSTQSDSAWETVLDNSSSIYPQEKFVHWLRNLKWTPELKIKWQEFYNKGSRRIILGGANELETNSEYIIPKYEDLKVEECRHSESLINCGIDQQKTFFIILFISFIIKHILIN